MDEYICREAFKARIREQQKKCASPDDIAAFTVFSFLLQAVDEEPAADVQPVKHGKWKHIAGMNSKCSECERYFPVQEFESRPFDINFCPQCGARMDGDIE